MAAERVCDAYAITATNAGGAPTDGSSVTLTDTLPPGLTVQRVQLFYSRSPGNDLSSVSAPLIYPWSDDVRKQAEALKP